MPYRIDFTTDGRGVIVTYEGRITEREVLAGLVERFADAERSQLLTYSLGDFTAVSAVDVSSGEVREVASRVREVLQRHAHLMAAIVAPADIAFGLGRMAQAYADDSGARIMVFRTRAEADAWVRAAVT
jgi:hypothetical protein